MKRILLAAALAGAALPAEAKADEDPASGNVLLKSCQETVKNEPTFFAGFCLGEVMALRSTMHFLSDAQEPIACIPENGGITNKQIALVLVNYLTSHAKDLNYSGTTLAMEALMDAWPCPSKKKP